MNQSRDQFQRYHLTIYGEKSTYLKNEVKFLGHIVSAVGIKSNPEKVEAITNLATPLTVKEIRSLLGIVNYYRRFVPKLAEIVVPLKKRLKKGSTTKPDEEMLRAVGRGFHRHDGRE